MQNVFKISHDHYFKAYYNLEIFKFHFKNCLLLYHVTRHALFYPGVKMPTI